MNESIKIAVDFVVITINGLVLYIITDLKDRISRLEKIFMEEKNGAMDTLYRRRS